MKPLTRAALAVTGLVLVGAGLAAGGLAYVMHESLPALDGRLRLASLTAPATIARDALGVPVITAANRLDLARATGFVHAQERYFQMDLLRRAGAGEVAGLIGEAGLNFDRERRLHRFRARAARILAAMAPDQRALLDAYTQGVNAGLAALGHAPWEYLPLRATPAPWRAEDSLLVSFAMFFDLQESDAGRQVLNQALRNRLGAAWDDFLFPRGTAFDAPLDGSHFPQPKLPAVLPAGPAASAQHAALNGDALPGSNNFAVDGAHSTTGAAIIESDMHLALSVPDIWFRARLVQPGALDAVGVTLPGQPFVIVGSNTHIAWALTNSYIETGDAVVIETDPHDPQSYRTPQGPRRIETVTERICAAHAGCEDLPIRETIWGPITGMDAQGRPVAWHWMADDDSAVRIAGLQALEQAKTVPEALAAAHQAGLPDQNFVVGDQAGHIAWTIIGQVPKRVGLTDQLPHSWADGSIGWQGFLAPADIPTVVDPPDGRLWSANARMLGGSAYDLLGDGGYGPANRARAIHDDLFARDKFSDNDMFAIANETRAGTLVPWQAVLLQAISAHKNNAVVAGLADPVRHWGERAVPASVGYRLVREFRAEALTLLYQGLSGVEVAPGLPAISRHADGPALQLLTERPAALVPPPYKTWDDLTQAALLPILARIRSEAGGAVSHYSWGARNTTGIHHPLARVIPLLGHLTDPPNQQVAGDAVVPRVAIPGFGASERLVVSPGHEGQGIFNLPTSQSDNPFSPYYMKGHEFWVAGTPAPLLPGDTRWVLALVP